MPFETYLNSPPYTNGGHVRQEDYSSQSGPSSSKQTLDHVDFYGTGQYHAGASASALQFQIPAFMMGAGASVVSPGSAAAMLQGGYASRHQDPSWMARKGVIPPDVAEQKEISSVTSIDQVFHQVNVPPIIPPPPPPPPAMRLPFSYTPSAYGGLPLYSTSGFDMLSILARVANRPNPKVQLGPVDLTCAFVVTDCRRYDNPIVYASPSFCSLTGYTESEVLGRNCRFLQAPGGNLQKGAIRQFTHDAVAKMKKELIADKECQEAVVNYRKNGEGFLNLVTVIPVPSDTDEGPMYYVGFQVNLTDQPKEIAQRIKDGRYYMAPIGPASGMGKLSFTDENNAISKEFRALLSDSTFRQSLTSLTSTPSISTMEKLDFTDDRTILNRMLLEYSPDFIHVLSLKGHFLYVSPSVRRVLGFEASELVGKSISDYCHEADVVPLLRDLKDSSGPAPTADNTPGAGYVPAVYPKTIDLLFRARTKAGTYVWIESVGRLHVEPGKGRKAVVLTGRIRDCIRSIDLDTVIHTGGLAVPSSKVPTPRPRASDAESEDRTKEEHEFWGMLSREGIFLVAGSSVRDILGWATGEMIGRPISDFISRMKIISEYHDPLENIVDVLSYVSGGRSETLQLLCDFRKRDGSMVEIEIVMYFSRQAEMMQVPSLNMGTGRPLESLPGHNLPMGVKAGVVCQFTVTRPSSPLLHLSTSSSKYTTASEANVFAELETRRTTSWQYELQQLKINNHKLSQELEAIRKTFQTNR